MLVFVFHVIERAVLSAAAERVRARYGSDVAIVVEQPKQSSFGELSLPVAFQLARELKKAPKVIAGELLEVLHGLPGVASIEIAGNGYLNLRFDRAAYVAALVAGKEAEASPERGKIIVEHTNINPNKAAHIGHLRNAILGDTFIRMLRASGQKVEVQNYIDNTGVQVADVVVGFHFLEQRTLEDVRELTATTRFDYVCWDLYARTSAYYKEQPESLAWRHETLHAIEAGEGVLAELGHLIADAIVQAHLRTMLRIGIQYDVLPRESEILHLQFWAQAFELLKERKAIYFETEGKNNGCWVMPGSAFSDRTDEEDSKVIVRSNGTVTYVGKDIAYQLWKFGLLGKDFHYRELLRYPDGQPLFVSSAQPQPDSAASFGQGSQVYNVIDSRQSYLQDVVVAGLRALGYEDAAEHSVHFSYEMVALSPRTCVELGIPLSEEDKRKPYVEVSGRKGLGVKADDLIDKLIEKAQQEVDSRHAESPAEQRRKVAEQLANGALRYFMLKFTRNSVIAFDLQEALSFDGETGPYVQYAITRANKILQNLKDSGEALPDFGTVLSREMLDNFAAHEGLWQMVLSASRLDVAIERAVQSGEPAAMARYAFQLAQAFSTFYHDHKVLKEEDPMRRTFLIWLTAYCQQQLQRTLQVLGIEAPAYM